MRHDSEFPVRRAFDGSKMKKLVWLFLVCNDLILHQVDGKYKFN